MSTSDASAGASASSTQASPAATAVKPLASNFKLNPEAPIFIPTSQHQAKSSGFEGVNKDLRRFSITDSYQQYNQMHSTNNYKHVQGNAGYIYLTGYGPNYGSGMGQGYHQPPQFHPPGRGYGFGMGTM